MNATMKTVLAAVAVAYLSDMAVRQFTDAADSDTERLIWRVGSAAAIGIAVAKVF